MMEFDSFIAWGEMGGGAGLGLTKPFDGNPATVGNGVMVAFEAKDAGQVHRIHEIALANGGSDEGAPGARGEPDEHGNRSEERSVGKERGSTCRSRGAPLH